MQELTIDTELLWAFEQGLDPRLPEQSQIPARVLGHGEISTVFEIGNANRRPLVYKRMPMFRTELEAHHYEELYREYVEVLRHIGLQIVPSAICRIANPDKNQVVVYIVQDKLPGEAIGNQAIRAAGLDAASRLILSTLQEIKKVFDFNQKNPDKLEVGLDGQMSNWAVHGFDAAALISGAEPDLVYLDTGTPLLRKDRQEQLNSELFLRCAPSFLVWILRLLYVKDIMTRYYDLRQVVVDLIANVYKEKRTDLVPSLVNVANRFLATEVQSDLSGPITVEEVCAYYRQDARIWRIYMSFRKLDRSLHGLLGRQYPYILPETVAR